MSFRSDISGTGAGEIMLFGVRVKVDPLRKSASLNNLSDYEPLDTNPINELPIPAPEAAGYVSADDAAPVTGGRKRGVPWTEEEHKRFLIGLQKVGKGDWRGISKKYVKTRNPTQVASHAQKYFLRRNNFNHRRRCSSLFDITTDSVTEMPMEEGTKNYQDSLHPQSTVPLSVTSNANGFSMAPYPVNTGPVLLSMQGGNTMENAAFGQSDRAINNSSAMLVLPVPMATTYSTMANLNLNHEMATDSSSPLSLSLSLSLGQDQTSTRDSGFQVISSFKHGDSFISVA